MHKIILCLIAVTVFTGCSSNPAYKEQMANAKPVLGKAVLIVENDPWGKSLLPLQTEYNAKFKALDGRKLSTTDDLVVAPGVHTLDVYCSFRRGTALQLQNTIEVKQRFEADTIYMMKVIIGKGTCGIAVLESP